MTELRTSEPSGLLLEVKMNTEELVIIGRVEDERDEAAAERDAYREALALALERLHRIETARQRVVRRRREARGRTAA